MEWSVGSEYKGNGPSPCGHGVAALASCSLLTIGDGDAVSVQGVLRVETYDKDGETKLSLTCIADAVLPLRAAPKERKAKAGDGSRDRYEKPAADRAEAALIAVAGLSKEGTRHA